MAGFVSFLLFVVSFVGLAVFVRCNQYRVKRLVWFTNQFFESGLLNRRDYTSLMSTYTSFLSYAAGFPDRKYYSGFYENLEFVAFYNRSKFVMKASALAVAIAFTGMLLMSVY